MAKGKLRKAEVPASPNRPAAGKVAQLGNNNSTPLLAKGHSYIGGELWGRKRI